VKQDFDFRNPTSVPEGQKVLTDFFCNVMGSPDSNRRQLNGMGGGISSLSKVCIVSKSADYTISDLDYTFIQVDVTGQNLDWSANCGNLSGAVGAFAVNHGLVDASPFLSASLRIFQTNTQKVFEACFDVDAQGKTFGVNKSFRIAGVSGKGAPVTLNYHNPGGAQTGKLLPTGNAQDVVEDIAVSIVDSSALVVYVRAHDLGKPDLTKLRPEQVDSDTELLARLEQIRVAAGKLLNINVTPQVPRIGVVAQPVDYASLDGTVVTTQEHDISVRMLSNGRTHLAIMGTAAMNLATACRIFGSIPYNFVGASEGEVTIAHPSGLVSLSADVRQKDEELTVVKVCMVRTERCLMVGQVFTDF